MSVQSRSSSSSYTPQIGMKHVVINRTKRDNFGGRGSLGGGYGGGFSMSSSVTRGPLYSSDVYKSLSSSGVASVRESRTKEKKEMQSLNEKLAEYIQTVRFLEAQNKMLAEQLAQLSGREKFDLQPIRDMYEAELNQARAVINEMTKEKAGVEAKVAGLEDEVERQAGCIDILEKQKLDYIAKINQLTTQVGEYEGELGSLRLRLRNLEDENDKSRELLRKANDDIKKLRADLDQETSAHITAAGLAQAFEDECEFYKALLDKIPQYSETNIKIQGIDLKDWWNQELKKCIRDITTEYDGVVDRMRDDMEMRMQSQMRQLQSGAVKENLESNQLREEVKRLKDQLGDRTRNLNDAEARVRTLESELADLMRQLSDSNRELEELRAKYSCDVDRLQSELEICLHEIKAIMDAKLSLELEICCYRQLLEGEENRAGLKQIVEQAIGTQSDSGNKLADYISSSGGSSSLSSTASGKMTQSRTSRGMFSFTQASPDGSFIELENNTSGTKAKTHSLLGWKIKRILSNKKEIEYVFDRDVQLGPGKKFRVYATGNAPEPGQHVGCEHVVNNRAFSWGGGTCTTLLIDEHGNEKASLKSTISSLK